MILDMADLSNGQVLTADLCIVGAGASGIAMGLQFINSGIDVLIVESGGRQRDAGIQDLYAGSVVRPELHASPDRFRCRQFGGSTTLWGGRCTPLDPIDFETRSYIPHSGWPFPYEELLPFYREANRLCEAGAFAYRVDEAFDRPLRPMIEGFDSENFTTDQIERFSMPTNFAARYGATLEAAPNVRVLLHATATDFSFSAAGKCVDKIKLRNLSGKSALVRAGAFVLATGGLEVARLLLANRQDYAEGIGNQHDVVGRYYMCHIAGSIGRIKFNKGNSSIWHGYDIADDMTYCRRRFALRPDVQKKHQIGNFIARLHHPDIADPSHHTAALSLVFLGSRILPWEYRTRVAFVDGMALPEYGRHIANLAADPLSAIRFAAQMLVGRFIAKRKIPSLVVASKASLFNLDFHGEQVPNPRSRIMLDTTRDALGLPRIKIDWQYTRQDVDTIGTAMKLLADDFRSSGVGVLDFRSEAIEDDIIRFGAYGGHHLGTARMGHDPRTSVVDPHCRVHGINNLFVVGGATFPTSSQANPTLTVVALALRLASHLNEQLRKLKLPLTETTIAPR